MILDRGAITLEFFPVAIDPRTTTGSACVRGEDLDSLYTDFSKAGPLDSAGPRSTHRADFPQWAPQSAFTELKSLDRWVQRVPRWQRQFEPLAAGQIAPVEPMPLALLAQRASPLQLDFTAYPVQLLLAVM